MQPTILIGLDGATFSVLDPLMADGQMPHLAALLAGGVRAELSSTPHPLTPPAWTTLMTGRTPGNHGIFDFLRGDVRGGGAFYTLNDFRDIRCETIWTIVSRMGGRVISLNFPLMAPPPEVAGSIVPGLLSWRHLRRNVYPAGLYDDLKALPGFDAKALSWDFENERKALQNLPEEELEPWVRFHIAREEQWFAIVHSLMESDPADLTAVMFDGVDKLQHGCWRFLDPAFLPDRPNAIERTMRDLCLEYFRALDGFIGRIAGSGGPEARVFIASDHGFGPNTRVFRVNKWLERQGYLRWQEGGPRPEDVAGPDRKAVSGRYVLLDWERTTAYAQSAATNGIHIKVRGGPDDYGVAPEEYEAFRARLVEQILAIRDPETGGPLVKAVLRRDDVFPGAHLDKAPDLTLVLCDHGFISVLDAEPIVEIRPTVMGTHYPEGIFLASGPGIEKGRTLPRQSILDIAPTLMYSLGLPIPSDFEGRPIEAAFEPAHRAAHPAVFGGGMATRETPASRAEGDEPYDEGEDEAILDRLRALGYVE